jgi:ribosome biogenesis GTPase / thiamine phosphate phosphatase
MRSRCVSTIGGSPVERPSPSPRPRFPLDPQDKASTQKRHQAQINKQLRRQERQANNNPERRSANKRKSRQSQWIAADDEPPIRRKSDRPPKAFVPKVSRKPEAELQWRHALVTATTKQHATVLWLEPDELDGVESLPPNDSPSGAIQPTAAARAEPASIRLQPGHERPVVGDQVRVDDQDRLAEIDPRRTRLARPDPRLAHRELVLAANVDVGVIVVAAASPAFRPGLIDRALVALERGGIQPLIVINKADLLAPDSDERAAIQTHLEIYASLGIPVVWTSGTTGAGLKELAEHLAGRTCVLVGHSGVGKSSLLNQLDPSRERKTNAGRAFDGKGRHTTTAAEMSWLPGDTWLIDTPGVRSFGLAFAPGEALLDCFPDLAALAADCQFRNCTHAVEAECALTGAREPLVQARLAIYRRLQASLEERH